MKKSILFAVFAAWFFTSCNGGKTKEFITGTYISNGAGEYSLANDTLVIKHSEGNHYDIHRKTGFNLIRDGKKGSRQYETEEWRAVYDEQTGTLTETQRGKLISFYPDENKLMVGKRAYKKLN